MSKIGAFPSLLFPEYCLCCFSGFVSDKHEQQQQQQNAKYLVSYIHEVKITNGDIILYSLSQRVICIA